MASSSEGANPTESYYQKKNPTERGKDTARVKLAPPEISESMERLRPSNDSIGAYAVQCGECSKWRLIPTKEEYETIRENFIEDPWFCSKRPNVSCEDSGDIEFDSSRLWIIDKPNLPRTPPNTERRLVMRKDFSKLDATYVMPNGKRVRSTIEVEKFLEAYPEYKDKLSVSSFSFTPPKIPENMVPGNSERKATPASNKKMKKTKD